MVSYSPSARQISLIKQKIPPPDLSAQFRSFLEMSNIIRQDRYRHLRRRRHPSSNSFQIATFQLNLRTPRLSLLLSSSSRCPAVAATKIDITLLRSRIWFNWTRLLFGIKSICFREILDFLARLIYNFSGV